MAATVFLAGDVMTGRGVDQILAHPSGPALREPWIRDARDYVALVEERGGPIARSVGPAEPWGDALDVLDRARPDARVVNLETSVTRSDDYWAGKEIHYRMHPDNVGCLTAARLDVCTLANNHVLDFGRAGLVETLATLAAAGIRTAGAGLDEAEAWRPAVVPLASGGRLRVFAVGEPWSGIAPDWAAAPGRPGVALLPELSDAVADRLTARAAEGRQRGDRVIVSIHWGSNWGYTVSPAQVRFARRLIDGGVDLVHGHSSHHPRPIERYRGRLILYGCGDLLNDYEGISGHEAYRSDLVALYLATLGDDGSLEALRLVPLRIRRMRLAAAAPGDSDWLRATLERASAPFRTRITDEEGGVLRV